MTTRKFRTTSGIFKYLNVDEKKYNQAKEKMHKEIRNDLIKVLNNPNYNYANEDKQELLDSYDNNIDAFPEGLLGISSSFTTERLHNLKNPPTWLNILDDYSKKAFNLNPQDFWKEYENNKDYEDYKNIYYNKRNNDVYTQPINNNAYIQPINNIVPSNNITSNQMNKNNRINISDTIYSENDNTYLSISFTNPNQGLLQEQTLEYNVTKTIPIIDDASKYYCSISAFNIPLTTIPLTVFPVQAGQGDTSPNISTLQVGITIGATTNYQFLLYVPQNKTIRPTQNNPNQQIVTPYYWVYSYEDLIVMINTALKTAYTLAGGTGTTPYFIYTPATQLISLIVGAEFNSASNAILINYPMLQYLNAFNFNAIGGQYYQFVIFGLVNENYAYYPNGQTPPTPPVPPPTPPAFIDPYYYKITQEYIYLGGWNPIRKILFITNTIPIKKQIVPANSNNANANNEGIFSSLPILQEFTP